MILADFRNILIIQSYIKMKKLLAIVPLLLMSCQKNESITETSTGQDSALMAGNEMDSPTNGMVVLDQEKPKSVTKAFRVIDGDSIIKTINADMIPLTISDEFTTDQQKYILKIKNFSEKKINATINPGTADMNVRFNQIKYADGTFDGPFGLEITQDLNKPGEIWLIVGKNLMASGKPTGKFTISLK